MTLEREVALKVLDPLLMRDAGWVARFMREAKAVAALNHPHIVTIYEIGEADGRLFIAMQLVQGPSLRQAIQARGRLPWDEVLTLLGQIADALDYAHGQGVVHRDLKPENALIDTTRGLVLTDFGFARLVGESSTSLSISGGIVGTPAYIAPEIWDGEKATAQTDLYALGCMAYEMLTGETLFVGRTPSEVMRKHVLDGPTFPATWPQEVPQGVGEVLQKALTRDLGNRYERAGDLAQALRLLSLGAKPQTSEAGHPRAEAGRRTTVDVAATQGDLDALVRSYLSTVTLRLRALGFECIENVQHEGWTFRHVARGRLALKWWGAGYAGPTPTDTFFVFAEFPAKTSNSLMLVKFSAVCFGYASAQAGLSGCSSALASRPRLYVFPVALSDDVQPGVSEAVQKGQPTSHRAAFELPVICNLGSGELFCFQGSTLQLQGLGIWKPLRSAVQELLVP